MSKDEIVVNLNQKLFKSGMLFVRVSYLVAVTDALTNTAEGRVGLSSWLQGGALGGWSLCLGQDRGSDNLFTLSRTPTHGSLLTVGWEVPSQ